jgi:NAD+ kinase
MKIAIYGRQFNDSVLPYVQQVFTYLEQHKVAIYIYTDLNDHLSGKINLPEGHKIFKRGDKLKDLIDVCITLGGDGTMLDTLAFIHDSGIPVIGINFGRLGFLASINKSDIAAAIHAVVNRKFTLDSRVLLQVESEHPYFACVFKRRVFKFVLGRWHCDINANRVNGIFVKLRRANCAATVRQCNYYTRCTA